MRANLLRRLAVVAALAMVVLGVGGLPAAAASDLPDIRVTMSFTKASYAVGDQAWLNIHIVNVGTGDSGLVRETGSKPTGIIFPATPQNWMPAFYLGPGQAQDLSWLGNIQDSALPLGRISMAMSFEADNGEANPADNTGVASALVPGAKGDLTVIVRSSTTGQPGGDGPGLPGVRLTLQDEAHVTVGTATTGTDGKSHFPNLAAGDYLLDAVAPTGWKLVEEVPTRVQVLGGESNEADLTATEDSTAASPSPSESGAGPVAGTPGSTAAPAGAGGGEALPVTGTNTGPIVGFGGGLLLLGAVAFLLSRRRRIRFTASENTLGDA